MSLINFSPKIWQLFCNPPAKKRQFNSFPFAVSSKVLSTNYVPSISVVLPVYNEERYIEKAISSILQQKGYPLELIVVNDGSADRTAQILNYLSQTSPIKVVHQDNQGLAAALNCGLERATGDFCAWTSADNFYLPNALYKLANFLLNNPSIGMVYANVELINEDGLPVTKSSYRRQDQDPQCRSKLLLPIDPTTLSEINDNFINACFLFRREVINNVGDYLTKCSGYEDYEYWLRLSLVSNIAHFDSDKVLYQYRLHPASLTSTLNIDQLSKNQKTSQVSCRNNKLLIKTPLQFMLHCAQSDASEQELSIGSLLESIGHQCTISKEPDNQRSNLELTNLPRKLEIENITGDDNWFNFSHSSLKGYLPFPKLSPFYLQICPDKISGRSAPILPPLNIPNWLKRARDCNFGAIIPNENSHFSCMIFCPDQLPDPLQQSMQVQKIATVISQLKHFTFVLFCQSKSQRQTGDDINRALNKNINLRIIDCSEEDTLSFPDRFPLLYTLSSVDLVLSIKPSQLSLSALLELRIELALASCGGRGVLLLTDQSVNVQTIELTKQESLIRSILLTSPNLWHYPVFESKIALNKLEIDNISDIFSRAVSSFTPGSAEQFLQMLTIKRVARQISSLFFSLQLN